MDWRGVSEVNLPRFVDLFIMEGNEEGGVKMAGCLMTPFLRLGKRS